MSDADRNTPIAAPSTRLRPPAKSPKRLRQSRPFLKRLFGSLVGGHPAENAAGTRDARRVILMCHSLLSEHGEVSGAGLDRGRARRRFNRSTPRRSIFFDLLVEEFSPDPASIVAAAERYRTDPSPKNLMRLQTAVEPRRQELFRRSTWLPLAPRQLIEMRRRFLPTLRSRHRSGRDRRRPRASVPVVVQWRLSGAAAD